MEMRKHMPTCSPAHQNGEAGLSLKRVGVSKGFFLLLSGLVMAAIFLKDLGNKVFGMILPNNVSAYLLYAVLLVIVFLLALRLPKILIWLYGLVILQTFVINFTPNFFFPSFVQMVGVIIFSLAIFNYVALSQNRLIHIVRLYYGLSIVAASFAIMQVVVFVIWGQAIYFQDMLGGPLVTAPFAPELLGGLPRAISVLSEPAHFAVLMLPSVYLSLLVLLGRAGPLGLRSKWHASILIVGFLLSFSLLGYLGLGMAFLLALGKKKASGIKKGSSIKPKIMQFASLLLAMGIGYMVFTETEFFKAKLSIFFVAPQSIDTYEFTAGDLSGFALISNLLVAKSSLVDCHFVGCGLKTHENSYNKYLPLHFSSSQVLSELNKTDAGSLFIRIASEFGVLGLMGVIWFIRRYKLHAERRGSWCYIVNEMSLIFLIVYMARTGSYLDASLWLFAAMYYYSYWHGEKPQIQEADISLRVCRKSALVT